MDNFDRALNRLLKERRKAQNVLIEDIEQDVTQKEKFLTE